MFSTACCLITLHVAESRFHPFSFLTFQQIHSVEPIPASVESLLARHHLRDRGLFLLAVGAGMRKYVLTHPLYLPNKSCIDRKHRQEENKSF